MSLPTHRGRSLVPKCLGERGNYISIYIIPMFSFFKRTIFLPDYGFLSVDIHSHILPGIDDGARELADSIALVKGLNELGFETLYATPHVIVDRYPNTPQTIDGALNKLQPALLSVGNNSVVGAAAEYLMDEGLDALLEGGSLKTLPGKRVLVEMPFVAPSPKMEEYIFKMQVAGYHPVMAHPERYNYWQDETEEWKRVLKLGCELQVNLLSLFGLYGKGARKRSFDLIERGWVSFLATDLHSEQQLFALKAGLRDRSVAKLLDGRSFLNSSLNPVQFQK